MSHIGDYAWRCRHEGATSDAEYRHDHEAHMFCPPEGCPKYARNSVGEWVAFGCARENGWKPGDESPRECMGLLPLAARTEGGDDA